ncbi:MAG: DUF4422 domain-containing protein [Lachnospiraceae bacterium]|nr:DUF4422 domain-containing protein [Lachnospiraceae bacterium]
MSKIYIAGAHSRAQTVAHYLTYLDNTIEIIAYLYDNDEDNPTEVNGIPVMKISGDTLLDTSCRVYLGVRGVNVEHLFNTLSECGMKDIVPVDADLDMKLRNDYLEKYYDEQGIDFVMDFIQKNHEEEYEDVVTFFEGSLYCPCNMMIAKKEVLDELCSWMFPIVFALYEHVGVHEDSYQNRYPGFVSERLITYFFESRRDKYNLVYCNKNFLN